MPSFNNILSSAFLIVAYASTTSAAPWPLSSKHATYSVRDITDGLQLETYHPMPTFETFGEGIDHPQQKRASEDLKESAISFVVAHLGLEPKAVSFRSGYSNDDTKYAYLNQVYNGVPFANAVANIGFNTEDKIVSFGSSFVEPSSIASSEPSLSLEAATALAQELLNGKFNDQPPTLEYLALDDGTAALVHVIQVQNDNQGIWKEAFVDAHSGQLLGFTDFVSKATYRVLPIKKQTVPEGFETLTDPEDAFASPKGWHTSDKTQGNNAYSYKGKVAGLIKAASYPSSGSSNYVYTQDPTQKPEATANVNAARVNAFYIVNTMHDISYRYGFTEKAFNFQNDNYGKGGKGNDYITISVQDAAGVDNADFSTPADGQPGHMRMFLWDFSTPGRDGALENDIIVHEATHGITNRMTGGGTGRCLQTTEAGGMGEGWSDAFAEWTEQRSATVKDYVLGQYVYNKPGGIRKYPYSTSAVTNPLRYSSLQGLTEVHAIGEIWANMLHNVYAALVASNGFSDNAFKDPTGNAGNVIFMRNFMKALALQPCNPTFVSARAAFVQANTDNGYGNAIKCTIWRAFASRGLGLNAVAGKYVDNSDVPVGC